MDSALLCLSGLAVGILVALDAYFTECKFLIATMIIAYLGIVVVSFTKSCLAGFLVSIPIWLAVGLFIKEMREKKA